MGQRRKLGEIDNWLEVALGDWGRAKVGGYSKASFGRREWNGIKGIFLEYSSLLLFGSFNGGNGMSIPSCLGVLTEGMECPFPRLGV